MCSGKTVSHLDSCFVRVAIWAGLCVLVSGAGHPELATVGIVLLTVSRFVGSSRNRPSST